MKDIHSKDFSKSFINTGWPQLLCTNMYWKIENRRIKCFVYIMLFNVTGCYFRGVFFPTLTQTCLKSAHKTFHQGLNNYSEWEYKVTVRVTCTSTYCFSCCIFKKHHVKHICIVTDCLGLIIPRYLGAIALGIHSKSVPQITFEWRKILRVTRILVRRGPEIKVCPKVLSEVCRTLSTVISTTIE